MIENYLKSNGFRIVEKLKLAGRGGQYFSTTDLSLSEQSRGFLQASFSDGIYGHQKEALGVMLKGHNVCLTTGTASGKSLPFYIAAMEKLVADPKSRVIVVYPLKALGSEQEERWIQALQTAGISASVGRIDGRTPMQTRMGILHNSRVLILTPDIMHAWLLFHVSDKAVMSFLFHVGLVIVDEVHYYTGVFGSNAAYLFRRLRHILQLLRVFPQFIAASATISRPENHLQDLIGLNFEIIGSDLDTSPKQAATISLVDVPAQGDLLTSLSELMDYISKNTKHKFIVFVDSRKQTEYLTSIAARLQSRRADGEDDDFIYDRHLENLDILPYRAGYEEYDRRQIQERLTLGMLNGVVSTSALELGLDIPYLTMGILVGVPYSATSFYQRIGRIGRHAHGEILIVNSGDIHSASIFRNPCKLFEMPLSEGALYLENQRVQYLQTLCLARHGGEHDRVNSFLGKKDLPEFASDILWPKGFIELCQAERIGEISSEFQTMKAQAGDDPNHAFPLRDVEVQFQVKYKKGAFEETRGSLTYRQIMREAYPGGIYYYTARPYRVYRVNISRRLVEVRREKRYTTKPQIIPTLVFPNLTEGNIFTGKRFGELIALESSLQIRESIIGYKERRGPNEISCLYPLDDKDNLYFELPRFTRNFFTTGVTFTHPAMTAPNVKIELIAQILLEAFLMALPLERRDVHFAADRHRVERGYIKEGAKFAAIFDQTYGSLRLSSRILDDRILKVLPENASNIIMLQQEEGSLDGLSETVLALEEILISLRCVPETISFEMPINESNNAEQLVKVILPGSKGFNMSNNDEFIVENVFYSPQLKSPAYRGYRHDENSSAGKDDKIIIALSSLGEIPGESKIGFYDLESGEIIAKEKSVK